MTLCGRHTAADCHRCRHAPAFAHSRAFKSIGRREKYLYLFDVCDGRCYRCRECVIDTVAVCVAVDEMSRRAGRDCLDQAICLNADLESIRDLARTREDVKPSRQKVRQQVHALVLRHGKHYTDKCTWTRAHRRWISDLTLDHSAQTIALEEYLATLDEASSRLERIESTLVGLAASWRFAPVVAALQALKGIDRISAILIVTELGDLTRFDSPRELMAFVGLVPSEHSTGARRRLGALTKCGNSHVRRLLVEPAWAYRHSPRIVRRLLDRAESLAPEVRAIAWKAQLRLTARFRKLAARTKPHQVVVTAVARELVGFVWAVARTQTLAR